MIKQPIINDMRYFNDITNINKLDIFIYGPFLFLVEKGGKIQ